MHNLFKANGPVEKIFTLYKSSDGVEDFRTMLNKHFPDTEYRGFGERFVQNGLKFRKNAKSQEPTHDVVRIHTLLFNRDYQQ